MKQLKLKVVLVPEKQMTYENYIYASVDDLRELGINHSAHPTLVKIHREGSIGQDYLVFSLATHSKVSPGTLALNAKQREFAKAPLDSMFKVELFHFPDDRFILSRLNFEVTSLRRGRKSTPMTIDCKVLSEEIIEKYGGMVVARGQSLIHYHSGDGGTPLELVAQDLQDFEGDKTSQGQILSTTEFMFSKGESDSPIRLTGQAVKKSVNSMVGVDFEKLGIGGLNEEFTKIFRRAFASRIFPAEVVARLGIKHVRGLMLYGPPGCGKTLIARQLSKVLQGDDSTREPKIVAGPEILNKFVGGSEEKIRELFKEAEEEQKAAGDESELHVIIFDEIDAICKKRGSTRDGTGVGDSVVNQLLAKIDGVDALNNILIIGMTNRLELIDSALLRPGRFEVHIEIGLPDEDGRKQILNIHTAKMRESHSLAPDVSIPELASKTKNFSGAEIEGLVKSAGSFAFLRHVNASGGNLTQTNNLENFMVYQKDFELALTEVKPAFGVEAEDELRLHYRSGILDYGEDIRKLRQTLSELAHQVETSERTALLSALLVGPTGSGKTALLAKTAADSGFPFVKMISAENMIGMGEIARCSHIQSVFEDSYKSPLSLIVIDDIERIIDYVSIGPRFSNPVLQAILVLVNKKPPNPKSRLFVVGTCSETVQLLSEITDRFTARLHVPLVRTEEEVLSVLREQTKIDDEVSDEELVRIAANCTKPIGIKKLILILEMAMNEPPLTAERFELCSLNFI